MIIKSGCRARAKGLANHLIDDKNDKVTIVGGLKLFNVDDVHKALKEMEAVGRVSNCKKYLYHTAVSPEEEINDEQWKTLWKIHDETHGITECPYIEIEHEKKVGRIDIVFIAVLMRLPVRL